MPTAPAKALAVYSAKARKAEGDEAGSLDLMKKKYEEDMAAERAKLPKKKEPKPTAVYGAKARKAEGDEVASIKKMAKGGKVSSASKRADGIAKRGKTKA